MRPSLYIERFRLCTYSSVRNVPNNSDFCCFLCFFLCFFYATVEGISCKMCSDNCCCCFLGRGSLLFFVCFSLLLRGSAVKGVLITVVVFWGGEVCCFMLFFVCFSLLLRGSAVKGVLITYDAMNLNK